MALIPEAGSVWKRPSSRHSAPIRLFIAFSLKMMPLTGALEDLVFPEVAGEDEAGSRKSRYPTGKKSWRKFPSRPARAFLKSPANSPSQKSIARFKKNYGTSTAWATRPTRPQPELGTTRSISPPNKKTCRCRRETGTIWRDRNRKASEVKKRKEIQSIAISA